MNVTAWQTSEVTSSDGVKLAVYESGNALGPEILFIHGFSQAALCWQRQFDDAALLREFRLTAFDIRGHGASDKPLEAARYSIDRQFAEDIQAVITGLGLKRPVLVAWSYAGRLVNDYAAAFGTAGLTGVNYVCARTMNDPRFNGPGTEFLSGMMSLDLARNIAATRGFLAACFAVPPPREDFETALAYNMVIPAEIRAAHLSRPPRDGADLAGLDLPVLVTQGSEDLLVSRGLGELTAELVPGASLSIYEGIGHSPFTEDAPRFNRELAAFVRAATSSNGSNHPA